MRKASLKAFVDVSREDHSKESPYCIGDITALRLAITFGHIMTGAYLRSVACLAGSAIIATLRHNTIASVFKKRGSPGFPRLHKYGPSCWTNK